MNRNPAEDPASTLRPALSDDGLPGDWIDRSQETYEPSPHESRFIPPSGDVSHDGRRIYPQPSLASKILVWGGIVAASAAATAASVLAVQTVVDGIAGSYEDDAVAEAKERAKARARKGGRGPKMPRNTHAGPRRRPSLAPRFAAMDEDEREAIRRRAEERFDHDDAEIERQRRRAAQSRGPRRRGPPPRKLGLLDGANKSINDVTETVAAAVATIGAAVEAFRGVAGQAGSIMSEFREAADSVKSMFDGIPTPAKPAPAEAAQRPERSNPDVVDLRDDAGERVHRL